MLRSSVAERRPHRLECDLVTLGGGIAAQPRQRTGTSAKSDKPPGLGVNRRGETAEGVLQGLIGANRGGGYSDSIVSKAQDIPGRATAPGTIFTVTRSTTFDKWHSATPWGWHMSRLGCATCKMPRDANEAAEAMHLQVIRGLNVFEFDGNMTEAIQSVSKAFSDALGAFELQREGFVVVMRAGTMRESENTKAQTDFELSNTLPIRNRMTNVVERFKTASLPAMTLKGSMDFANMSDGELKDLQLRRINKRTVAAITPRWLEATLTNAAFHARFETIDVFLVEGLHTLFEAGRNPEDAEKDILEIFLFLEQLVAQGSIQYYGVSSPNLAPPLPRQYPPLPKDANLPERFKHVVPPMVLNVYTLLSLAHKAGGANHHMRVLSYPFNLTQSQARFVRLPYAPDDTLTSLCTKLGLATMSHSPVETVDLMDSPQRYHRFPHHYDLNTLRMQFYSICEKVVMKEVEVRPYIEKMASPPPLEHVFIGSVYVMAQRQFSNYFVFQDWINNWVYPNFRPALNRLREGATRDIKEWCAGYEQIVQDMLRVRLQLFEFKHGRAILGVEQAIDRLSPVLKRCPIVTQKALNFATHGADVVLCGFHQTRYFQEATEMNPLVGDGKRVPEDQLVALANSTDVSFVNYDPPHPYMYEPLTSNQPTGPISGQASPSHTLLKAVDPKQPEWPDIPKNLQEPEGRMTSGPPGTLGRE